MNDLEDRLRTALRAQAKDFTVSPDAWRRTTDRAGARGGARRRLLPFASGTAGSGRRGGPGRFAPLAAAAAVVALAVATAAVAGTGGWRDLVPGRPAATPQDGPSTPVDQGGPGSRGREAIEQTCGSPVTAVVSFAGMSLWVSRSHSTRAGLTGLRLCDSYGGASAPGGAGSAAAGGAGSGPAALPPGSLALERGVDPGRGLWGRAITSVTSVTADLANGRKIAGQVLLAGGFPVALWEVNYPLDDSAVIVFRSAAGHVVTTLSRPVARPAKPLPHPAALPAADAGPCVGNGWNSALARAPQTVDGHQTWTYVQFGRSPGGGPNALSLCATVGLLNDSTSDATTLPGLAAGELAAGELDLGPTSSAMGIAAPAVVSVTAVLADGTMYPGVFVHGSGFPYPVWLVSYPTHDAATFLFRDVAGQVVTTLHANANGLPMG